jgi:hypothetical protein
MSKEYGVLDYVQGLSLGSDDIREAWTELIGCSHGRKTKFDRQRGRNRLELFDRFNMEWVIWIPQHCNSGQLWLYFLK